MRVSIDWATDTLRPPGNMEKHLDLPFVCPHRGSVKSVETESRHPQKDSIRAGLIFGSHALFGPKFTPVRPKLTLFQFRTSFRPQNGHEDDTSKGLSTFERIKEVSTVLISLSKLANVDIGDTLIREIEGLALMTFSLVNCNDPMQMCMIILLYLRSFTNASLYSVIEPYVKDLFTMSTQEGEEIDAAMAAGVPLELEKLQAPASTQLITTIQNVVRDWTLVKSSPFFSHVSKILGLVVMSGLCEATTLSLSVKDFKLCEPHLFDAHSSAVDIIDAALTSTVFFVERFYAAYQAGDASLIVIDEKTRDLDERYAKLTAQWVLVQTGNLERVTGVPVHVFDRDLEAMSRDLRTVLPSLKGFDKRLVADKFAKLLEIRNNYTTMQISSGLRRAPFVVEICGLSSQGKTTLGDQLITALLASQDLPTSNSFRAVYNSSDDYFSIWTTDKLVLIMDDCWNEKPEISGKTGVLKIILDVCNNQMAYANMADLPKKDKTFLLPELVFMYTNEKTLLAKQTCVCPYAIQRRPDVVITCQGRPEFQRYQDGMPQGLDPEKIMEWAEENGHPLFDDTWLLTCEKAVQPACLSAVADYEVMKDKNGKPLDSVPFMDVVQFLINKFDLHRILQQQIIDRKSERAAIMTKCDIDGCRQIKGYCDVHLEDRYEPLEVPPPSPLEIYRREMRDRLSQPRLDMCSPGKCNACLGYHMNRGTEGKLDLQVLLNEISDQEEIPRMSLEAVFPPKPPDPTHNNKKRKGPMDRHGGNEPYGLRISNALKTATGHISKKITSDAIGFGEKVETAVSTAIYGSALAFVARWDWLWFVPSSIVEDERFTKALMYFDSSRVVRSFALFTFSNAAATVAAFATSYKFLDGPIAYYVMAVAGTSALVRQKMFVKCVETDYRKKLLERNTLETSIQKFRDEHAGRVCASALAVGTLYTLAKVYRAWKSHEPQGSLEPKDASEVAQRDSESNPWAEVAVRKLPLSETSKTTAPAKFEQALQNNLLYASIDSEGNTTKMANVTFIDSNRAVIPRHYFDLCGEIIDVTFRKKNPDCVGGKFCDRISLSQCHQVLNDDGTPHDLVVAHVNTGGSFKNISRWLPVARLPLFQFKLFYRNGNGEVTTNRGSARGGKARTHAACFEGGEYTTLEYDTFPGLCGAPLLSESSGACIAGFHLGGFAGTKQGCFGMLTQDQYEKACEDLDSRHLIKSGSATVFDTQSYGINILDPVEPSPKSPVNFLPPDSQFVYYGKCPGEIVHSQSDVRKTIISQSVTKYCNVENKWHGPKFKPEWFGWQACLASLAHPATSFPQDLLEKAREDYVAPLREIFSSDLWKDIKPLTEKENLNGIPGVKFIDALKKNTSPGFPLSGTKADFIEGEDGEREFVPLIRNEVARHLECYKRGDRAYVVAKGCKKDEVLAKMNKCRVYYANAVAFVYNTRKYFLPLGRVLQMNPIASECAVGINSHGPEWDELMVFCQKYGNLIGGDYSKYDQKIPAQLLLCAFSILIELAKLCNYSEEDIRVMKAMTGDLVYSLVAFNGHLIQLTEGGHISGNSLTVILNSIVGSLNMRCVYYDAQLSPYGTFRENVALTTYGDDNYGSVSDSIKDRFNITVISEFLDRYGQTYTMPDKDSELAPFLPDAGTFLCRRSVLHPELGFTIGALDENSIFKSLHRYLRPRKHPLTPEHASAMNIDTALFEFFNHGREVYERRQEELRLVAEECDISHLCTRLTESYDDRVEKWKEKYLNGYTKWASVNPDDENDTAS